MSPTFSEESATHCSVQRHHSTEPAASSVASVSLGSVQLDLRRYFGKSAMDRCGPAYRHTEVKGLRQVKLRGLRKAGTKENSNKARLSGLRRYFQSLP